MDAINRTIDNSVERNVVKSPDTFSEVGYCKALLSKLIRMRDKTEEVEEFILCAYGLINLFEQAAFTMDEYEYHIEHYGANIRSPRKQIDRLYGLSVNLPIEKYREGAQLVAIALDEMYKSIYDHNYKRDELLHRLQVTYDEGKFCGIVVPKRNYIDITNVVCSNFSRARIVLASHLSRDIDIDRLIITATPNIKRDGYNPLAGRVAPDTILLEYEDETVKNNCYQRMIDRAFEVINRAAKRSALDIFGEAVDATSFGTNDQEGEAELAEFETLETELANIETNVTIGQTLSAIRPSATTLRAIRFAQFDTGEWAVFSQYYTAYVLDEKEQKLVEKSPISLLPGDVAIFSASGEEITDFVDDILKRLILSGNNVLSQHYERSKHWKKALNEYIRVDNLTYRDISNAMRDLGHSRHAVTVGTWLREDSVIVGPRDTNAFIAIGLVADDSEIADHANLYKDSCDYIRNQRTKILNYVQTSIIRSVIGSKEHTGKDDTLSSEEITYLGDIQKYARKLTIERIVPCERDIPIHLINRPVGR